MNVAEHSKASQVIDHDRLEDLVGGFAFRVGAIAVAPWELEQKESQTRDTVLALLAELQGIVRQLPISARPDDTLDLSRLPSWARASLERRFAVLLRSLLRVPACESEPATHA
jgi:hypothetical protein